MAGGSTVRTTINIGGEVDSSVNSAFSQVNDYAEKMAPTFSKLSQLAGTAVLSIGAAIGVGAVSFTDYDEAVRQLQASTGELGSDLADVMQQVYGDNFGFTSMDIGNEISSDRNENMN